MWQIIKRDWYSMWPFIVFAFGFVAVIYALQWDPPNGFLLSYLLIFLFASLFFNESKSKVNRFFISLPVKRKHIVLGRYLFVIGFGHLFILFTWLIDIVFPLGERLSGEEFIIMIMMMNFIIAVSIPIYYAINEIWLAIIIQTIVLLVSTFIFVYIAADPYDIFNSFMEVLLYIVDLQPILFVITTSIVMLTISIFISQFIFLRKDIQ